MNMNQRVLWIEDKVETWSFFYAGVPRERLVLIIRDAILADRYKRLRHDDKTAIVKLLVDESKS